MCVFRGASSAVVVDAVMTTYLTYRYIRSVVYPIHVMVRQRCGELGLVKTLWLQAG